MWLQQTKFFLVGELRSHVPRGVAKRKTKVGWGGKWEGGLGGGNVCIPMAELC